MNAPDRSNLIASTIAFHTGLFAQGEDGRRELCNIICRYLNTLDGGKWGRLVKKDRQPWGYPADIIVWKDTMEHFDVLTDTGAMWRAHGPIENPQWEWFAVEGTPVPQPEITPAPEPNPPSLELAALQSKVAEIQNNLGVLAGGFTNVQKDIDELKARPTQTVDMDAILTAVTDTLVAKGRTNPLFGKAVDVFYALVRRA